MGALWIRALGPLDLSVDGTPVALGAGQQRKVLAFLALRANAVVTTDALVEALWPGSPPRKPVPQLQVYVATLRRVLDPDRPKGEPSRRLASRSAGYVLSVDGEELDLLSFREQASAGEQAVEDGDLERGADCLRAAVGLFRGPAFPDLADVELLRPELEALEEARLNLYQDLFDVELALGRHSSVIGELHALVAHHRYRERLWASLVLALYRCDRQAEALAVSTEARRVFTHELGIDPGPRLRALEAAVLKQDPSLDAPALDGHRKPRQRVDNLPAETTELVGRETELKELCNLYGSRSSRLVTVTGPGGTGKTRLTLAAARQLLPRAADGACWVDLAPLTQEDQVPAALAGALGLEIAGGADPLKVVTQFLHQRHLLLVLDNFEHVEGAWPVVVDLLTAAPDLRVFATSRSPIGVRAEQEYQLGPLALPPADPCLSPDLLQEVPSVGLLLARGKAVRPGLTLTAQNSSCIARICRRLDGLPLAIELAAAQLRHKDEAGLLADLSASLAELPAAFRDVPDRQKTLTATITWSHQLLGREERELFDLLGLFAADPTVAAVNGVFTAPFRIDHGSTEGLLAALARHSMIRLYTDPMRTLRVSMLQPIREFARNRIASRKDASLARRRHAEYYVRLAEDIGPLLWGEDQVAAFRLLHADAPDLRGALLWASGPDGSLELALKLVGELWHYWELTGVLEEPCRIAEQLVARAEDLPSALTAGALSGTATLCWLLGRNERAADLHQRSLRAFQEAGSQSGVAWATVCLAVQAAEMDDVETSRELATQAASYPKAGPRTRLAAVMILGLLAFYAGDTARAQECSHEAVRLARELGDRWLLGVALINRADVIQRAGDYAKAEQLLHEALSSALELGAEGYVVNVLESLSGVYVDQGRAELAVRVLGAAAAYRADRGHPPAVAERERIEAMIAPARATLGPISYALNWAAGQALTLRQALREVHPDIDTASLPDAGSPQQLPANVGITVGPRDTTPAPW